MEKHDPNSASYLATFAFALARVAYADNEVGEEVRTEMRRFLHDVAHLQDGEADFIMEISMMQKRAQVEMGGNNLKGGLDIDRKQLLVDSLYAIAQANGHVGDEELVEIRAISAEFGLEDKHQEGTPPLI